MIVLEGPDGSGKTTLLKQLAEHYSTSLVVHERASEGVKGPVDDLYQWAHDDLYSWLIQPLSLYDRHPLVSEYIYGPVIRGSIDPRFFHSPLRRLFARRALTIVCLPPQDVVRRAVSDERDMPGVSTHIDTIWTLYASLKASWPCATGLLYYDWTEALDADLSQIHSHIHHHMKNWEYLID